MTQPVDVGLGIVLRPAALPPTAHGGQEPGRYEILITKRNPNTVYGGFWELPGGKCDPDEDPDACTARELREEVGVLVRVIGALPEVIHTYPHATVRLLPRLCVLDPASPPPANLHVAEHRWVRIDELADFQFPEANHLVIRALAEVLRRGLSLP